MPTYRVTFEGGRVGRRSNVEPVLLRAADPAGLVDAVFGHVRPLLMSRDVDVVAEEQAPGRVAGFICAGVRSVARFRAEQLDGAEPVFLVRVRYHREFASGPAWFYVGRRGRLVGGARAKTGARLHTEEEARRYTGRLLVDNPNLLAWRIVAEDGSVLASAAQQQ